jgi:hypothetical protein
MYSVPARVLYSINVPVDGRMTTEGCFTSVVITSESGTIKPHNPRTSLKVLHREE